MNVPRPVEAGRKARQISTPRFPQLRKILLIGTGRVAEGMVIFNLPPRLR
jgi:hypothetical protein